MRFLLPPMVSAPSPCELSITSKGRLFGFEASGIEEVEIGREERVGLSVETDDDIEDDVVIDEEEETVFERRDEEGM